MKSIPAQSTARRENDRQISLIKVDEKFLDNTFVA